MAPVLDRPDSSLAWQASLFGLAGTAAPDDAAAALDRLQPDRIVLGDGAWLDTCPGWCRDADALFERLLHAVPWRAERRRMYERVVDVPRLLAFYAEGEPLPDPVLDVLLGALNSRYSGELGERFTTAGLCLYRDGRDSVAWHGDYIAREDAARDTMIAIVSLGQPRSLLLRRKGGGAATVRHELGHGDLVVMGGTCQRTWEHAVPKTAKPVGPRISIQFRPHGVR